MKNQPRVSLARQLAASCKRTPCPICGRTKDTDCRWDDTVILCHQGATSGPPAHLKPGDTIDVAGQPWALIRRDGGHSGAACVFRPHREDSKSTQAPRSDAAELERQARHTVAVHAIERFLANAQAAWEVEDWFYRPPEDFRKDFELIYATEQEGLSLARSLPQIWRDHPDLRDRYRVKVEASVKFMGFQRADVDHFRRHDLVEVI
jgi:hypothetical protein